MVATTESGRGFPRSFSSAFSRDGSRPTLGSVGLKVQARPMARTAVVRTASGMELSATRSPRSPAYSGADPHIQQPVYSPHPCLEPFEGRHAPTRPSRRCRSAREGGIPRQHVHRVPLDAEADELPLQRPRLLQGMGQVQHRVHDQPGVGHPSFPAPRDGRGEQHPGLEETIAGGGHHQGGTER